jgi:type II secretory pathway component PulF
VTTDSAEHRSGDDVSLVPGTWAADPGPDAPVPETSKAVDDAEADSEFEAAARLRHEPWRLRHMMGLVAIIAVALWLVITLRWLILVAIVLMGFAMIVGLGFVLARLRMSRQDSLLGLLAIAAERGMPLSPAVAAFADQFRGKTRRRAMNVIARLDSGGLLPEALAETPKAVSRDAVLMAWVGQVTGMLPQALRLAGTLRAAQLSLWMATATRLAYLMGVFLAVQCVMAFLVYKSFPRHMEAIFRDFGLRLPEITNVVARLSEMLFDYAPVSIMVGISEVLLFMYIPFSFGGWMNYNVPILDRLLTRRHTALILRALSLVIESNKPIAIGLSTLSNHYPTKWVRRRLVRVETDVRLGSDWIDSLWRAGLLRMADVEVLGSAASVGNLPWALRELAETSERRQTNRIQSALQTLFPLVVILIGLAIALLTLAYFLPLVILIGELSDQ